jgi:hypothetical protein
MPLRPHDKPEGAASLAAAESSNAPERERPRIMNSGTAWDELGRTLMENG